MTCVRKATSDEKVDGLYGTVTVKKGGSVTVYNDAATISISMPNKIIEPKCNAQIVSIPAPPYPANPPTWVGVCRGCIGYPGLITDNHETNSAGSGPLRSIRFNFVVPSCGDYNLFASYASPSHRPVRIFVDGSLETNEGLSGATPADWSHPKSDWPAELVLPMRAGPHEIRLESQDAFPHVAGLRLEPR